MIMIFKIIILCIQRPLLNPYNNKLNAKKLGAQINVQKEYFIIFLSKYGIFIHLRFGDNKNAF